MLLIVIMAIISGGLSILLVAQFLRFLHDKSKVSRILTTAVSVLTLAFGFALAVILETNLKLDSIELSASTINLVELTVRINYALSLASLGFLLLTSTLKGINQLKKK